MRQSVTITCISCPLGCQIEVTKKGTEWEVEGNQCKNGKKYAVQEVTNPMRSITSTVKTTFSDFPRVSVKTDGDVPLKDIFEYMKEINDITVDTRLKPGDMVKTGLLDSEVNLVATSDMTCIDS
jgi:CxxC motif-containing protein